MEVFSRNFRLAIIIPVRNHPEFLRQCLSSLAKQSFPRKHFEVLICDDGSTENIQAVVEKYRGILDIRLLHQKQKGPAAARNMGFRSSSAEIFICIDSDVICLPDFVERLVEGLKSHPAWVAAEATVIPTDGSDSPLWDAPVNKGNAFLSAASAYRADAVRRVGGFDEGFRLAACEDTDLAARLLILGKYGYIPEAMVYHPRRRITLRTHWRWREYWRYVTILAERYGFLGFPGNPAGPFPKLRVGLAAMITLPGGRLIEGIKYIRCKPLDGILACLYAVFDVLCGIWALPSIIYPKVPPQRDYLSHRE